MDRGDNLFPIEIKSGETINNSFFSSISKWNKISLKDPKHSTIIYAGNKNQSRMKAKIISWQHADQYVSDLYKIKI